MSNLEKKTITLEDLEAHFRAHFPLFMESDSFFGVPFFQYDNAHYSFERFADFLINEGLKKDDHVLIQKIAGCINLLLAESDDTVQNPVYVSFIEALVDRGHRSNQYPQLNDFIWQMPEDVRTFIKGFFIEEVLISLDLKNV